MTDEQTTDVTPEAAEADLARLEQAVVEGEAVTPEDLTKARERITFAQLVARGKAARAEAARRREAEQLREETKRRIAGRLAEREGSDADAAYREAVTALTKLVAAVRDDAQIITEAAREFDRAGVNGPNNDWTPSEGFDRENYPHYSFGRLLALTSHGKQYTLQNPAHRVMEAVSEVLIAEQVAGTPLRLNGGRDLRSALPEVR
jgi:hypothetical protein